MGVTYSRIGLMYVKKRNSLNSGSLQLSEMFICFTLKCAVATILEIYFFELQFDNSPNGQLVEWLVHEMGLARSVLKD